MKNILRCFLTALLSGLLVMTVGLFEPTTAQFLDVTSLMNLMELKPNQVSKLSESGDTAFADLLPVQIVTEAAAYQNLDDYKESKNTGQALASDYIDPVKSDSAKKIAHLTFDDGPSNTVTVKILDVLDEYQVKATFFVVGTWIEKYPEIVLRAFNEGHAIGNHSYSHRYKDVYRNADFFRGEVNQCGDILEEVIGHRPTIFRAPGGSNIRLMNNYIDQLSEMNYQYYDWNVSPGDAAVGQKSAQTLVNNVMQQALGKNNIIVLMHDSANMYNSLEALPKIIEGLKDMGYSFEVITSDTEPIQFYRKHKYKK
jgi:peptidoglycan/xylan/chitin deacetylase (PgdA/CDA1 family)